MTTTHTFRDNDETVRFEHDDQTGQVVVKRTTKVGPILNNNKALQTENDGYSPSRELRRVANVPVVMLENWCREAGISVRHFMANRRHYQKWLRRKIYDPDNRFVLTAPHKSHVGGAKSYNPELDKAVADGRKRVEAARKVC